MGIMTDALHLEDARGAVFLDVGAGSGAAVAYLNERFGSETIRAYGIEPALVKATSGLFKGGLEVVGSAPGLPSAFDVVAFLDVLEHFEDPAGVLARTREILKSGGKLLVKVPNREAALYQFAKCSRALLPGVSRQLFRRLYQAGYPPPHYFYFDRASLTALLTAAGFRVETVGFISETPLPHLWTRLWGMLFPVRVAAFIALSLFKLVAFGRRQECIYVVARVVP
jgi:SAM-dependent methyltransferase